MKFTAPTEISALDLLINKGVYHTKTKAKQIFQKGLVWINNDRVRNPSVILKKGDIIEIDGEKSKRTDNVGKQKFKILFEDDHLIVILKNANFSVMKSAASTPSMTNWVQDYVSLQKGKFQKCYALNALHDGESGVLMYSKGMNLMEGGLSLDFEYHIISDKNLEMEEKTISNSLILNKSKVWVAQKDTKDPKTQTRFVLVKRNQKLFQYQAFTTNPKQAQVRAHLMAAGIAAVGDSKYGSKFKLKRLGIHLYRLSFVHPVTNENMSFVAPKPPTLRID